VLDELPSLEFAATAVALVLVLRAALLSRAGAALFQRRARNDSGRARDLVGLMLIGGAVLYVIRAQRASTWFLAASGVAILAQVTGFVLRSLARRRATAGPSIEVDEADDDDDDGDGDALNGCPSCGHGTLIELEDTARLLGGLSQFSPVTATVCPQCGALYGQVEDPSKIPIGDGHGTSLRKSPSGEDAEALEEPTEHHG
jgi:hypothetical protein